jgi:hypothetical protein
VGIDIYPANANGARSSKFGDLGNDLANDLANDFETGGENDLNIVLGTSRLAEINSSGPETAPVAS